MQRRSTRTIKRLDERLILFPYMLDLLGFKDFEALKRFLGEGEVREGFDDDGQSYISKALETRKGLKIDRDRLIQYDENIKACLDKLNRSREERVILKYFQYVALLFTEIYLDNYFNNREDFLDSLNKFVRARNERVHLGDDKLPEFQESDLNKLAFWIATGGGKTLLMHLNYYQFLRYNQGPNKLHFDNILLVTPNEGLSAQHIREMSKSGVPCKRFDEARGDNTEDLVKVIEITKLTTEKKGEGVSVEVEELGPRNLLFVDEGHKGTSTEAKTWRARREDISREGFAFEYSATFGQAINVSKRDEIVNEYSKAIVMDYSYKHFHGDGYGKDFWILNLKDEFYGESDKLLLGNALSFYEQRLIYKEHPHEIRDYNLEPPLWVFVGSKVTAIYTEHGEKQSDVLKVVSFLYKLLREEGWAISNISAILREDSGLKDVRGRDIFADKLTYLKAKNWDSKDIYRAMIKELTGSDPPGNLVLVDLKNAEGEIGLKVAGSERYFGIINIGDKPGFLKLAEEKLPHIRKEEDRITSSLFDRIEEPESPITILIGAKKFIEGWDCWRVSSMGLLNVGRGEGPQIIQLFGRGVRLKGKGMSLKRSSKSANETPDYLPALETLSVFGIRANYMETFREMIGREGIELCERIPVEIKVNQDFLGKDLKVLRKGSGADFAEEVVFVLAPDRSLKEVRVNKWPRVETVSGENREEAVGGDEGNNRNEDLVKHLDYLDWDWLYLEMLRYKAEKGWSNMVIKRENLRAILEPQKEANGYLYCLYCPSDYLEFKGDFSKDKARIEDIALTILKQYARTLYTKKFKEWETTKLGYQELTAEDANLKFSYTVEIEAESIEVIRKIKEEIEKLIKQQKLFTEDVDDPLPNIHFDRHLYQPLLVEPDPDKKIKSISPPGLNEGEKKFVKDLRSYFQANPDKFKDKEIFLLRNLSRGKGVHFFNAISFYPDFILWIKTDSKQYITFIDPHGLFYCGGLKDPKIQLFRDLRELQSKLGDQNIVLNSFIISVEAYEKWGKHFGDITKEEFLENHVLFQDDREYIEQLINEILA
jgi:hypothetical protein